MISHEEAKICLSQYEHHKILDKWVEVATVSDKRGLGVDNDRGHGAR